MVNFYEWKEIHYLVLSVMVTSLQRRFEAGELVFLLVTIAKNYCQFIHSVLMIFADVLEKQSCFQMIQMKVVVFFFKKWTVTSSDISVKVRET